MSTYASPFNNRVYKRKFDHDEARRRRGEGESVSAIAASYGVSPLAVARATDPHMRAKMDVASREWMAAHPRRDLCDCGREKSKSSKRCRECYVATLAHADPVDASGNVWCTACARYLSPSLFLHDPRKPLRGFRRTFCRSCETKARQDFRERRKIPCVCCGAPALPKIEKGARGGELPRCRACYYESRQGVVAA